MISIVIPAYNEEELIASCLDALTRQQKSEPFEIILVDNNSTDSTKEIAYTYKDKLDLSIVELKKRGRGTARAAGFKASKGSVIFSTDADTIVPVNWIKKITTFLREKQAIAVTGTCTFTGRPPLENALLSGIQPVCMIAYRLLYGYYWLSGFNFAIQKRVYEKSGGFDPELNSLEDIDLSIRVARLGTIAFLPSIPVTCSGRRFKTGFLGGFISYLDTFKKYQTMSKRNVVMQDIR